MCCGQIIGMYFPQPINFGRGYLLAQSVFSTLSAADFDILKSHMCELCKSGTVLLLGVCNVNVDRQRQICQRETFAIESVKMVTRSRPSLQTVGVREAERN